MPVGSVVEDKTLAGLQSILREWALLCYHGNLYVTICVGHLTDG